MTQADNRPSQSPLWYPLTFLGGRVCSGIACVGILLAGCSAAKPTPPPSKPIAVEVSPVIEHEITDYADYTGRTVAMETVEIRARASGYISEVAFQDGGLINKGDLLYIIDQRPYQVELDRAQSGVAQAQAQVQQSIALLNQKKAEIDRIQAEVALSQKTFDRTERLAAQGAAAAEAIDSSQANLTKSKAALVAAIADSELATATVATAEAATQASQASVEQARLNLEYTELRAPISGRISRTSVTKGNLIQATDQGRATLTSIVSRNPIYVDFDIDERTVLRVKRLIREGKAEKVADGNVQVSFGLADEAGFPHSGWLTFFENKVNSGTGTLSVRGTFDTGEMEISAGLFARIRLPIGRPHRAVLVSERAVMADLGQKIVLVVNDKNEVVARPVKLGQMHDGLRVVEQGLQPNDRVIVNGLQRVAPGVVVEPRVVEMPTAAGTSTQPAVLSPPTAAPAPVSDSQK